MTKGAGFRGALNYLLREGKPEKAFAHVIATNMAGATPRELAAEFGMFRRLRPTLSKAVFHASLSTPPTDPKQLSDAEWATVTERFLREMGFEDSDTPFIVVKHEEKSHKHCHVLASRIGHKGVISDSKDFQRAEKILREIEKDYGLYTVLPKPISTPKTIRKRRSTMNEEQKKAIEERLEGSADLAEESHREMLGQAPVTDAVTCADPLTDKTLRDQRRIVLSDEYELALRAVFLDEIRHIYRAGPGLVVYFKDNSRLSDFGNRIVAYKMSPKDSARRLIDACALRQWKKIILTGSDEFIMEAMRLALAQGIEVVPTSDKQKAMLMAVLAERAGYPTLAAHPTPRLTTNYAAPPQPAPADPPLPALTRALLPPPKPIEPEPAPSAFGEEIARKLALRRKEEAERLESSRRGRGPTFR